MRPVFAARWTEAAIRSADKQRVICVFSRISQLTLDFLGGLLSIQRQNCHSPEAIGTIISADNGSHVQNVEAPALDNPESTAPRI
jgi:hypothetical protein